MLMKKSLKGYSYLSFKTILPVITVLIILLPSCINTRKIDKWVAREYVDLPSASKKKVDFLTIHSKLPEMGNKISATERESQKFLPLLFYWEWQYKNRCFINPQIPEVNFTKTITSQANKELKEKLNGRRVELTIEKLPDNFLFRKKGSLIFLVVYYVTSDKFAIDASLNNMEISFKVFDPENKPERDGKISIENQDKGVDFKFYQSLKKRTGRYLNDYDDNITAMSKQVLEKLIAEL